MRLALLFACVVASAGAFAQQAPAAATRPPSTETPAPVAPPARLGNDELLALLRAQTAAIKALSLKIDALEIRLGEVETKQR